MTKTIQFDTFDDRGGKGAADAGGSREVLVGIQARLRAQLATQSAGPKFPPLNFTSTPTSIGKSEGDSMQGKDLDTGRRLHNGGPLKSCSAALADASHNCL